MVATDNCKGFMVEIFADLAVDVVLVDKAAVVVPHCELYADLRFDALLLMLLFDSLAVVAFYLAVYLVVVAVLNRLVGLKFMLMLFFWFLPLFKRF